MSNFQTYAPVTAGLTGTAPQIWIAVTTDSLATVITAGYIADKVASGETKVRDVWFITYADGAGGVGVASFVVTSTSSGSFVYFAEAYDPALLSIAALTTAANKMIYTTASDVYATADLTAFARTLLDDSDAATARTTLGAQSQANLLAGQFNYAGGSETVTITGVTGLTSGKPAFVSVSASTNNVVIRKVTSGSNQIVVIFDADPGASTVLNYFADIN